MSNFPRITAYNSNTSLNASGLDNVYLNLDGISFSVSYSYDFDRIENAAAISFEPIAVGAKLVETKSGNNSEIGFALDGCGAIIRHEILSIAEQIVNVRFELNFDDELKQNCFREISGGYKIDLGKKHIEMFSDEFKKELQTRYKIVLFGKRILSRGENVLELSIYKGEEKR